MGHLTYTKTQAQSRTALEHLTSPNNLSDQLSVFLLCCKVDELSPITINGYEGNIGRFIRFLSSIGVETAESVTATHVRMYLLESQKRCVPASVHDYYRVINRFFNWQVAEGMLPINPMATIRPPKVPQKLVKPLTAQNISDMLEICSDDGVLGIRNKAIILILLDTGLRVGELASIQIKDIDIENETIRVMGKGAKERIVRIGKKTQKALLRYLLMRNDDLPWLWVNERKVRFTTKGIRRMIEVLGQRAEFDGVRCTPHTFRHTFAIEFLRNGGGEFMLQMMLGHATLTMTRRYVGALCGADMIEAHKKFSPADNMKIK